MTFETFLVGGAVRDKILGVNPKDLDFVMLAPSFEEMKNSLLEQGAKIFVEKPEFVTIRCHHPILGAADFACGRREDDYSDGRHPDKVNITSNLVEDLARRDFTIGAIAQHTITGEIIDPFDGQKDIQNRLIRAVGNPQKRFQEDKLRVFRALRFSITKSFQIENLTSEAIRNTESSDFTNVSTNRIQDELLKMFSFNSFLASNMIFGVFPFLGKLVIERGIWLEPTTKKNPQQINKKNFKEVME